MRMVLCAITTHSVYSDSADHIQLLHFTTEDEEFFSNNRVFFYHFFYILVAWISRRFQSKFIMKIYSITNQWYLFYLSYNFSQSLNRLTSQNVIIVLFFLQTEEVLRSSRCLLPRISYIRYLEKKNYIFLFWKKGRISSY